MSNEEIAINIYNNGQTYSVSTFIDEDTIVAGCGKLDYDFEFPLPNEIIIKEYGTTSWWEYFNRRGLYQWLITDNILKSTYRSGYMTEEELLKNTETHFTYEKI